MPASVLAPFHPAVATWFHRALGDPTRAQTLGWPVIGRGESTLLLAPTGSGKTLAAFLVAIDRLLRSPPAGRAARTRVLYVSPLKALAFDIERNLQAPLTGVAAVADAAGDALRLPTIGVRTGDTPARERARMARAPSDILITTPESLYLLLTSRAGEALAGVETVIVDEIHALVPTKRGAHLALSLERLESLRDRAAPALQRIGLSATQRPPDEAARLLGGYADGRARAVTVVDTGARKEIAVVVENVLPTAAGAAEGEPRAPGNWPAIHARLVELVRAHRSTIVFVNSRRLAERLAAAVNDVAGEEIALAHHGSLAPERRAALEGRLKAGELRAMVATSSLELGIDMGAVDLVVQIEAPPSVASGLQRFGRASHGVRGVPHGVLLPKHRPDLLACGAAAASVRAGEVEETRYPRNPLDVLAQQIVATVAMHAMGEHDLFDLVRGAAPFSDLSRRAFEDVLDMLSGRYPSDDFAELRPRITWDRARRRIEARTGAHRLAVTNGGTIPDRGLYGVFEASGGEGAARGDPSGTGRAGRRVGELDEEMVFELREKEVFLLGASSWRAEQITHDRVLVSPAAGEPGKMPFWHGDRPGRARAFGLRIGELTRRLASERRSPEWLLERHAMTAGAADAALAFVREQVEATGEVPSDRTVIVERFADEVGDWRVVVLCPLGTRVLAPWAIAVARRLREKYADVDLHYTDDGMAFRIPACEAPPATELFLPAAREVESMVTVALDGTALFAARFRECAARALLLPRRDPRRRTPLWAQRKRAADLLAVAGRHPTFPIVLETYRECLRDTFDLPGLVALLEDVEARRIDVRTVDTRRPSPFAAHVLFLFVARFIYEADAPPAERRAMSLSIDFERLAELLGETELRSLLDPDVIDEHERGLQRVAQPATSLDGLHDVLLSVGDLSESELRARARAEHAEAWAAALVSAGRAVVTVIAGERRWIAVEDAARVRDALGAPLPQGLPTALLAQTHDAARELLLRFARTHGPFSADEAAARFGVAQESIAAGATALVREGRLVRGAFRSDRPQRDLCSRDVLEVLRRKSLARARRSIEPVPPAALARFLPEWQGVIRKRRGRDGVRAVVSELRGCPLLASMLESHVLPARIEPYRPWDLDALCASGEVVWAGIEASGAHDGRIALYPAEDEARLARVRPRVEGATADALRSVLERRGAVFFADLAREAGGFPNEVLEVLWQMVWAGEVTNDTLEPLRSRVRGGAAVEPRRRPGRLVRGPRGALPGSEGRWSLRSARWRETPTETERRTATAQALLDRYGVVTREAAHAEDVEGGFASVYVVLKAFEERGHVRRGYFIEGRGGAQFALPGAEERLRAARPATGPGTPDQAEGAAGALVLAATDPASAWGALLKWPAGPSPEPDLRPQRSAGAIVVQRGEALIGWMGRGQHPLLTFLPPEEPARSDAARLLAQALGDLVDRTTRPALLVSTIDGVDAAKSPLVAPFVGAGFAATADGLLKRRAGTHPRSAEASTP